MLNDAKVYRLGGYVVVVCAYGLLPPGAAPPTRDPPPLKAPPEVPRGALRTDREY